MSDCSHGARTSWTARTIIAIDRPLVTRTFLALISLTAATSVAAQGVREHTRLVPRGTAVTQSQGEAVTLTVGSVSPRLVQTWIRAAGVIDKTNKILSTDVSGPDAALIKVGQRVRAFPPSAKSSMYQAFVTRVSSRALDRVTVEAS